jgi:hypothetical protein
MERGDSYLCIYIYNYNLLYTAYILLIIALSYIIFVSKTVVWKRVGVRIINLLKGLLVYKKFHKG